ncbi:MAG: oligosaccharide flippase family protein [Candidatus Eisenbacteria bacterium]
MKRVVLSGVAWVGGTMFLVRSVRYVALLVLGALLGPSDFGLFAALYVVIDGLAMLQGFGIGHALVVHRGDDEKAADTAFYLAFGVAAGLALIAWFVAPHVSSFYNEPRITAPFRAALLILLAQALRLVPLRMFEKTLEFRKKLVPSLTGSVAYVAVALFLALRGAGVWALVCGELASVGGEALVYWLISPWRPRFRFDPRIARSLLSFGWAVLGGSVLVFAFRNIDRVTLSRVVGTAELGVYAFAYALAGLPATLLVRILNTVLFPAYSSLGEDRGKQGELYFRACSYMAAAGVLYALGLATFGGPFLTAMYVDKWAAAVVPLSILGVLSFFKAQGGLLGDLLVATGHPTEFRRITLLQVVLAAAGVLFAAVRWGLAGVAVTMTAAAAVATVFGWRAVARVLGVGGAPFARAFGGPLFAAVVSLWPARWLAGVAADAGGLAPVVAGVLAMTAVFSAVWYAVDGHLRSDVATWRSRNDPAGSGGGRTD